MFICISIYQRRRFDVGASSLDRGWRVVDWAIAWLCVFVSYLIPTSCADIFQVIGCMVMSILSAVAAGLCLLFTSLSCVLYVEVDPNRCLDPIWAHPYTCSHRVNNSFFRGFHLLKIWHIELFRIRNSKIELNTGHFILSSYAQHKLA